MDGTTCNRFSTWTDSRFPSLVTLEDESWGSSQGREAAEGGALPVLVGGCAGQAVGSMLSVDGCCFSFLYTLNLFPSWTDPDGGVQKGSIQGSKGESVEQFQCLGFSTKPGPGFLIPHGSVWWLVALALWWQRDQAKEEWCHCQRRGRLLLPASRWVTHPPGFDKAWRSDLQVLQLFGLADNIQQS